MSAFPNIRIMYCKFIQGQPECGYLDITEYSDRKWPIQFTFNGVFQITISFLAYEHGTIPDSLPVIVEYNARSSFDSK